MKKIIFAFATSLTVLSAFAQSNSFQPHPSCSNANCSAVCDAARAQVERDVEAAVTRAVEITGRVGAAQSCSQQIINQVNRQIPSFGGGGFLDAIASQLLSSAANEACSVMGRVPRGIPNNFGAASGIAVPLPLPSGAPAPAAQDSLLEILLKIF